MVEEDGFSELSRAFKSDPTIENYVFLRRKHPNEIIEVAITGGLDWLFGNQQLFEAWAISPHLVASVLDADSSAISELSLFLLERIIERKSLERLGNTHLASRGGGNKRPPY